MEIVPLLVLMAVFAVASGVVARRKRRRVWLWVLLGALLGALLPFAARATITYLPGVHSWLVGDRPEFEEDISPFWIYFFIAVFAMVGATVAAIVAREHERRWWIWVAPGAVFPLVPRLLGPSLEDSQLGDLIPVHMTMALILAASALGCGYLARIKGWRVWLWVVLGAVFGYFALIAIAVLPRLGQSYLGETLDAAIGPPPEPWLRRQVNRWRGRERAAYNHTPE